MKYIIKRAEPVGLDCARRHNLNWEKFRKSCHELYDVCCDQAREEQLGECAYTGMPLNSSANIHIDHFKKKSIYPKLTFDWNNLFLAIKDNRYGADHKDRYIDGENAINSYFMLINPALDDPSKYFWYSNNGEVRPKDNLTEFDKQKASITIDVFNLNNRVLLSRRRDLFEIIKCYQDLEEGDVLSSLEGYGFSFVIREFLWYLP